MKRHPILWQIVLALLLTTSSLLAGAASYKEYSASYKLISTFNNKEIGYYRVSLNHSNSSENVADPETYTLQGEIYFEYPTLFSKNVYHYKDRVLYDSRGVVSLSIDIQDKTPVTIKGERSADGSILSLRKYVLGQNKVIAQTQFNHADYDYTLFALRFPQPCNSPAANHQVKARLLNVVEWKIDRSSSSPITAENSAEYIPTQPVAGIDQACLYLIKSTNKKMNKFSWLTPDGYLLYEKTPDYILILDEDKSVLPTKASGTVK